MQARLVAARIEDTGDPSRGALEVILADPRSGEQLLATFPDPDCARNAGSLRQRQIENARAAFISACGAPPPTHFGRVLGSARITGVGLFGSTLGHPRGVPRNGLGLRPVLSFSSVDCRAVSERPASIAAAGDIACDPLRASSNGGEGTPGACQMLATSDLLLGTGLRAVLPLGDAQYTDGAYWKFLQSYDPTWGRVRSITHPVVGNHEYRIRGALGYFRYFGARAGPPGKGYYSYDIGAWHLIALNGNCRRIGGCGPADPQARWLRADLAAHPNRCVLAYWHQPHFSSGSRGNDDGGSTAALWSALYDANADVVLNGHDHDYERFAPQTPTGQPDPMRGIREFVVGTGGEELLRPKAPQPNSEVLSSTSFGVLMLTLYPTSYDWRFLPVAGKTFTDAGSTTCH